MYFGKNILKYKQDILRDLAELIGIQSYATEGSAARPYGEACQEALEWILNKGTEIGLATRNIKNRVGYIEYGSGADYNAALAHVDVVPPGKGWLSDPFCLIEKNGRLYGRGVVDNKGPAVVVLYCLKALKDHNVLGKTKFRAIFGAGEECGMKDIKAYLDEEPLPAMAFTPDSGYGVCNCEKGIFQFGINAESPQKAENIIRNFEAGTVINAVPDLAIATLNISKNEAEVLAALGNKLAINPEIEAVPDGYQLTVKGIAAHGSIPEKGKNAAALAIDLLAKSFGEEKLEGLCSFLHSFIGTETDGSRLLAKNNEGTKDLSLNLGTVKIDGKSAKAQVDIRYPASVKPEDLSEIITKKIKPFGLKFNLLESKPVLFVSEDTPLIKLLKDAYREVTNQEAETFATGMGTYARELKNRAVSFGPIFPGEESSIHNANENIDIDKFFLHAEICLEAIYKMIS